MTIRRRAGRFGRLRSLGRLSVRSRRLLKHLQGAFPTETGPGGGGAPDGGIACTPPMVSCGTYCADTNYDRYNCGSCGNVCPGGYACQAGGCVPGPDGGAIMCNRLIRRAV